MNEPTVSFRVESANEAHVILAVFVGRNPDARSLAGKITMRTDELVEMLPDAATAEVLWQLGISNQLTLRGQITPHNPDALQVVGLAWQRHNDKPKDDR